MSQSPNSSSSYRQTSQFSSPIPYGSPHHGSPHQHYQPYGSPSSLPPPVSNHQWQPIPPPKVKAATSPKRDSPVKNPLPKNDPLDLKAEHFLQMGFNSDSVKRALQISQNEQNVLDFLFYFEEMVRQGHDPDATQRIIQLVGIADKTSIQSILTNVVGLMEMGFSPIDCVEALHECKNDKEIALDLLLNKK
jgi:hypothetical protein